MSDLSEKVESLPQSCGVYIFRAKDGKPVYIGKAKNLLARVRSYFRRSGDDRYFVRHLSEHANDIDFVVTSNEKEALILENNLIKQFHPRFNVDLRDDKTYISLKLDRSKPFPRLQITRRRKEDGALYFGPYSSAASAKETYRYVNTVFPLRKCSDYELKHRARPCIHFEMGRCLAPCCGLAGEDAYDEILDQVVMVLRGRGQDLARALREEMEQASAEFDFEKAARLRDRIASLDHTLERQDITLPVFEDRDVFGFHASSEKMYVQVLFVRHGRLEDIALYTFSMGFFDPNQVFEDFLHQFYAGARFIPAQVLLPLEIEGADALAEWLSEKKGRKIEVAAPQRGEKRRLVDLANSNAAVACETKMTAGDSWRDVLHEIQERLALRNLPRRIECFDISNIQGQIAVGSMVTFVDGAPARNRYRKFKIRTVHQADDFSMMREVLARRFRRGKDENDLPDLALVDGGKGQLSVAREVFERLEIEGVDLAAIAKARPNQARAGRAQAEEDRFFLVGDADPVHFPSNSAALHLLQRLRDEAHRFAITYHRRLRRKEQNPTPLDNIPGVGPKRKRVLLKTLGNLDGIRKATLADLRATEGIPSDLAETIYDYFHRALGESA